MCCKNVLKKLNTIKKCIEKEAKNIFNFFNGGKNIEKFSSELFELDVYNNKWDKKSAGIYVFQITKYTNYSNTFNNVANGAKLNKKNHLLSNIPIDSDFLKGQILYVGKDENDIKERIEQHFSNSYKTTYSLRLTHKNRLFLCESVKVFCFLVKNEFKDVSNLFLSVCEQQLHELLLPRVGK